jgi:hypothetical protein
VVVEGLALPDLPEGRVRVVGAHHEVRVHLDRDGAGVAHEPLDVERLAHRPPDLRVVLFHLGDAAKFQGAVQHPHVRRHVVVKGTGVLLVEPSNVGVEVRLFHCGSNLLTVI